MQKKKTTNDFYKVYDYGKGTLWYPRNNKMRLSLLYSDNKSLSKDDIDNYGMIDDKYLIPVKYNEFSLLNRGSNFTINRNKLKDQDENKEFKLISNDSKYISLTPDGKLLLDSKNTNGTGKDFNKYQKIMYTTDGYLKINDKCLTADDNKIYVDNCKEQQSILNKNNLYDKNMIDQKWYIYDSNYIVSQYNSKCMSHNMSEFNEDVLIPETCSDKPEQMWNFEYNDIEKSTDYSNENILNGKSVVLVESDNPWYLNTKYTVPQNYVEETTPDGMITLGDKYDDNYEYSKRERYAKFFESFDNMDGDISILKNVVCSSILILLLVLLYCFIKNKFMKR